MTAGVKRHDLDRSTMHANLSTMSAKFGHLTTRAAALAITQALAAWYEDHGTDMYAFTRTWIERHRKDLLPLR